MTNSVVCPFVRGRLAGYSELSASMKRFARAYGDGWSRLAVEMGLSVRTGRLATLGHVCPVEMGLPVRTGERLVNESRAFDCAYGDG
jgi:hypothetical protein